MCGNTWYTMIGGCYGSTPLNIKAIMGATKELKPRPLGEPCKPVMRLNGLEPLAAEDCVNTIGLPSLNAGECCNIAGSSRAKTPMMNHNYADAMDTAKLHV
jgi:hypothetical protein